MRGGGAKIQNFAEMADFGHLFPGASVGAERPPMSPLVPPLYNLHLVEITKRTQETKIETADTHNLSKPICTIIFERLALHKQTHHTHLQLNHLPIPNQLFI